MRFIEDVDGHGEDCIWVENGDNPIPVLLKRQVGPYVWPHIVRALTAGPTIESARVVIEALKDEIEALREANSELTCANTDLNRELTSLRRAHA